MAGYVIHLAIAKEYINKHKNEIRDEDKFLDGVIAPDLIPKVNKNIPKSESHYGKKGFSDIESHLDLFLADSNVDMKKDYYKGYLMHLYTDNEFYLNYFKEEMKEVVNNKDTFYNDYYGLNKYLIEKYSIKKTGNKIIDEYMNFSDSKPRYLNLDKVIKFIDEISDKDLEEIVNQVKDNK